MVVVLVEIARAPAATVAVAAVFSGNVRTANMDRIVPDRLGLSLRVLRHEKSARRRFL